MDIDDPEFRALAERSRESLAKIEAPTYVVMRARTLLNMATLGLADVEGSDPDRVLYGFLNVAVYGRSALLVMAKLADIDKDAYAGWYASWRDRIEHNPLATYFREVRDDVVHFSKRRPISTLLGGFGPNMKPLGTVAVEGLPAPPTHLDQPIDDQSMPNLCRLYVAFVKEVFASFAPVGFAVTDRLIEEAEAARKGSWGSRIPQ